MDVAHVSRYRHVAGVVPVSALVGRGDAIDRRKRSPHDRELTGKEWVRRYLSAIAFVNSPHETAARELLNGVRAERCSDKLGPGAA